MLRFQLADTSQAGMVASIIAQSFAQQAQVLGNHQTHFPDFCACETGERVFNRMCQGDQIVLAYEPADHDPIGTISYRVEPKNQCGEIHRLAVLPGYRGRDYGQHLMTHAENKLSESGIHRVRVHVVAQFTALEKFYERLGYQPLQTCSFPSVPFEVIIMEKTCQ